MNPRAFAPSGKCGDAHSLRARQRSDNPGGLISLADGPRARLKCRFERLRERMFSAVRGCLYQTQRCRFDCFLASPVPAAERSVPPCGPVLALLRDDLWFPCTRPLCPLLPGRVTGDWKGAMATTRNDLAGSFRVSLHSICQLVCSRPTEVADCLVLPVTTLYTWRYKSPALEALKVGKHLRYRLADV